MRLAPRPGAASRLLDLDPDLGTHVSEARRAVVADALTVRTVSLPPGRWEPDSDDVGVLVIEGLLTKDVSVPGSRATEILGAGDFVAPAEVAAENAFVAVTLSWTVLETSTVVVVDERFLEALRDFPEVT